MLISSRQSGFTLIEIAIVLLVVTIMLGYTLAMFPIQQELKQYRRAESELKDIIDQLVGFAQINGRLPCPDTSAGLGNVDGQEDTLANDCEAFFGFLPGRTLGMVGNYDNSGRLLDPWGAPYRYAVSEVDASGDGVIDLVSANGVRSEGLVSVVPDLYVCDGSDALGNDLTCADVTGAQVVGNVAAVVLSTGKDRAQVASNIQTENIDDFHSGQNDKVYIYSTRNDSTGDEFDDVVKWLSPNFLFTKMIEADQLP